MLDWLTMKTEVINMPADTLHAMRQRQGLIYKMAADGTCEWMTPSREIVRSDSHQIQFHLTNHHMMLFGSPARVVSKDNVFGSGDIVECAQRMIKFAADQLRAVLPGHECWSVTRADITHNYDLTAPALVRQALNTLRHAHGGRYQIRTESESVYWSVRSRHQSGKAYHKGPHLEYLRKQGAEFTDEEIHLAHRLLRLELRLGSQWWHQTATKPWHEYTAQDFDQIHAAYFKPLIGNAEVTEMTDIKQQCIDAAKSLSMTEGRGKAAYAYWCTVCAEGYEQARDCTNRRTAQQHEQVLKQAGLSFSDFQARRVVALRRQPLVLAQPVTRWEQLRAAA